MFKIQWRKPAEFDPYRRVLQTITGMTRYITQEAAEHQKEIWERLFPFNRYYIIPSS